MRTHATKEHLEQVCSPRRETKETEDVDGVIIRTITISPGPHLNFELVKVNLRQYSFWDRSQKRAQKVLIPREQTPVSFFYLHTA